jgi:hypothetical protein
LGWLGVIEAVRAEERQVTRVWHPEPEGALLHLKDGVHAEVLIGEPAYQVSSGETVAL